MTKALPAIRKSLLPAAMFMVLTAGLSCAGFAKEAVWAPPALQQLIDEALENNRLLQSKTDRAEALKTRIPAAGALPDPKIGFALQSLPTDSFAFDQEPMTQKQIFVEQTVPWLSKLDLRSEAAAAEARQKQAELEAARLELARDVAVAWYELGYVAESQQINDELTELMGRIRRDAQTRYGVGRGLQQNIYQAGVELSRLKDEAVRLENRRTTIEDRLHELTNRGERASIAPPANLPEPGFVLSADKLAAQALEKNPDLQGMQAQIQTARAQKQLAQKDYYPDFNIRLTYGQREEDRTGRDLPDFFSAAVAMEIPLWHKRKQSNEVAAASGKAFSAQNQYRDLRTRLPYRIQSLAAEINDTRRRYRLYTQELIPQAGQWARSAQEAYEVDRVAFDTMIDARIRVLKYRREASRLFFDIYQKRAELEAWVGGTAEAKH